MAVPNTSPVHVATPKSWVVAIPATANANVDGTGTITDIIVPAAGTQALAAAIKAVALGAVAAATMIRIFGYDGTAYRLLHELSVAITAAPSGTLKCAIAGAADGVLTPDGYLVLNMPVGPGASGVAGTIQKIGISVHTANAFAVHVKGDGDFQ